MYKVIKLSESIRGHHIAIGIYGDIGVGKTCIFDTLSSPPLFGINPFSNFKFIKIHLNNDKYLDVSLLDINFTGDYKAIILNFSKYLHGGIIVFDVTSKRSFVHVSEWLEQIKEISPNFFVIIFGNKADIDKSEWEVTNEEINKFIEEKKLIYYEVSAKTKKNINKGIYYIANEIYEKEYIIIKPKKK
jgi:small GTP-binding protein